MVEAKFYKEKFSDLSAVQYNDHWFVWLFFSFYQPLSRLCLQFHLCLSRRSALRILLHARPLTMTNYRVSSSQPEESRIKVVDLTGEILSPENAYRNNRTKFWSEVKLPLCVALGRTFPHPLLLFSMLNMNSYTSGRKLFMFGFYCLTNNRCTLATAWFLSKQLTQHWCQSSYYFTLIFFTDNLKCYIGWTFI